jgi:phospholipase C
MSAEMARRPWRVQPVAAGADDRPSSRFTPVMEFGPMLLSTFRKTLAQRMKRAARVRRLRQPARPEVSRLEDRLTLSLSALHNIDHFIIIYQENWSFDALYGSFPGANGIANASPTSLTQVDRLTGQPLSDSTTFNRAYTSGPSILQNPPPPLTSANQVDTRFVTDPSNPNSPTAVNTLLPYDLSQFLSPGQTTGDIVHRYWQEQSQIDGGNQDQFVTWSDNPGLVMSSFDATNLPEGLLAQQYTMDDNFFHAAYGGSFLNHQFLVAAAAPVYPNAPAPCRRRWTPTASWRS